MTPLRPTRVTAGRLCAEQEMHTSNALTHILRYAVGLHILQGQYRSGNPNEVAFVSEPKPKIHIFTDKNLSEAAYTSENVRPQRNGRRRDRETCASTSGEERRMRDGDKICCGLL